MVHTLDPSLGFFEHISKDLGLENRNTGLPFGNSFIWSNLNVNRLPIRNGCLGSCGLKLLGYKRFACRECSMRIAIENTDKELNNLNDSMRSKFKKKVSTKCLYFFSQEQNSEMLNSNTDPDFKKSVKTDALWGEKFSKKHDYKEVTYNQARSQVIFLF